MKAPADISTPLLTIDDLAVSFPGARGTRAFAVNGVSLRVHAGETLAIVGESGSGKSVTAMSVLRLLQSPPARYDRGRILLNSGTESLDLLTIPERELRKVRGGKIAMIFQEPMTSLNPVYTIGEQIVEAITLHQHLTGAAARAAAAAALAEVGIDNPAQRLRAYPHEFSGGMRQRVMIAMALACKPRLLIADEPTTALDVTIQAQILNLLRELRKRTGMGMMLISHALGVVAEHADTVCVMYAGRVLEYAPVLDLFDRPLHPYTRGLMRSIPSVRTRTPRLTTIAELVNDPKQFEPLLGPTQAATPWWPANDPQSDPVLHEIEPRHWVACRRAGAHSGASR